MDRGVKGGDGGCLGVDYECEGIERGVVMGRTHTRRTHAGLVNLGTGALNQGAWQGQGGGLSGGDVSFWGEMEGKMMICGRACGNHPTTLTASWWAGYSGREGGGWGKQWAEPRWSLEETGKGGEGSGFFL